MHVEERPISSIRPYENNPRLNDAAVDAVAASIKQFGFRQPIVVDEQAVIVPRDCLRDEGGMQVSQGEFLRLLDCCRLHLAVQYVGWATTWSPPADQRQDWLAEAVSLARKLGL